MELYTVRKNSADPSYSSEARNQKNRFSFKKKDPKKPRRRKRKKIAEEAAEAVNFETTAT